MPETLFLTTNLIDRFLETKQITRKNLQLVSVTILLHVYAVSFLGPRREATCSVQPSCSMV